MSLIYNRDNVPSAYADKSRDYQVLLKLFDLVTNSIKLDLENYSSLLDPESCPDHMLPLLATLYEYNYDYNETPNTNRVIMRYYPSLLRHKGNELGIKTAMLLSCDISAIFNPESNNKDFINKIIAEYDYDNATIYLYYPGYLNKVRDLIEVVRPAGMKIVFLAYDLITSIEVIGIYDDLIIINQEDYKGSLRNLSNYSDNPKSYFILDEGRTSIIGIGTDSRSVISDDYYNKGSQVISIPKEAIPPNELKYTIFNGVGNTKTGSNENTINPGELNNIDINNYLKSIKPTLDRPELIGSGETLSYRDGRIPYIKQQSRIGFSEIAGISEGDDE